MIILDWMEAWSVPLFNPCSARQLDVHVKIINR